MITSPDTQALTAETFKRVAIDPQDILDGIKTVECHDCVSIDLCRDWVWEHQYLKWARQGLELSDNFGLSTARVHSKRAVCRRIDGLIIHRHLGAALRKANYPEKIDALVATGVKIPDIVYQYVIKQRNLDEHDYRTPDKEGVNEGVQIADLFLDATKDDASQLAVIAIGGDSLEMLFPMQFYNVKAYQFKNLPDQSFVFIDVFDQTKSVKLFIPKDRETRIAPLNAFTTEQIIELWQLIDQRQDHRWYRRRNYNWGTDIGDWGGIEIFTNIKNIAKL